MSRSIKYLAKLRPNRFICSAGFLFTSKHHTHTHSLTHTHTHTHTHIHTHTHTHSQTDRQTNCSENITYPRFRGGVNIKGKKTHFTMDMSFNQKSFFFHFCTIHWYDRSNQNYHWKFHIQMYVISFIFRDMLQNTKYVTYSK